MKNKLNYLITAIVLLIIIFIFIVFNKKQNVNTVYPSVVHIECKNKTTTTTGSGIVYNIKHNKQYIVTSYHIIKGYSKIFVYDKNFNKEIATIINYDEENDIAILYINDSLNTKKASFDTSFNLVKNDQLYIMTSNMNEKNSYIIKDGIASDVNYEIYINDNLFNTIKLSYNVENGDSGSPLINKKGKIIGMIFLKDTDESKCGYALPIDFVLSKIKILEIINDSLNLGAIMTNSTNKELLNENNIEDYGLEGVVVLSLKKDYPLYNAGLENGSIIVNFDGKKVTTVKELQSYLKKLKFNSEVKISFYKNNKLVNGTIKLNK